MKKIDLTGSAHHRRITHSKTYRLFRGGFFVSVFAGQRWLEKGRPACHDAFCKACSCCLPFSYVSSRLQLCTTNLSPSTANPVRSQKKRLKMDSDGFGAVTHSSASQFPPQSKATRYVIDYILLFYCTTVLYILMWWWFICSYLVTIKTGLSAMDRSVLLVLFCFFR